MQIGGDALQVTTDTDRIVARGNGYTNRATIQDYTLLKAAETVNRAGATHFAMVGADDASSAVRHVSYGRYLTTASTTVKPGANAIIKVMTLPPSSNLPPGTFQTDEIIRIIGSRVERPSDDGRKLAPVKPN